MDSRLVGDMDYAIEQWRARYLELNADLIHEFEGFGRRIRGRRPRCHSGAIDSYPFLSSGSGSCVFERSFSLQDRYRNISGNFGKRKARESSRSILIGKYSTNPRRRVEGLKLQYRHGAREEVSEV